MKNHFTKEEVMMNYDDLINGSKNQIIHDQRGACSINRVTCFPQKTSKTHQGKYTEYEKNKRIEKCFFFHQVFQILRIKLCVNSVRIFCNETLCLEKKIAPAIVTHLSIGDPVNGRIDKYWLILNLAQLSKSFQHNDRYWNFGLDTSETKKTTPIFYPKLFSAFSVADKGFDRKNPRLTKSLFRIRDRGISRKRKRGIQNSRHQKLDVRNKCLSRIEAIDSCQKIELRKNVFLDNMGVESKGLISKKKIHSRILSQNTNPLLQRYCVERLSLLYLQDKDVDISIPHRQNAKVFQFQFVLSSSIRILSTLSRMFSCFKFFNQKKHETNQEKIFVSQLKVDLDFHEMVFSRICTSEEKRNRNRVKIHNLRACSSFFLNVYETKKSLQARNENLRNSWNPGCYSLFLDDASISHGPTEKNLQSQSLSDQVIPDMKTLPSYKDKNIFDRVDWEMRKTLAFIMRQHRLNLKNICFNRIAKNKSKEGLSIRESDTYDEIYVFLRLVSLNENKCNRLERCYLLNTKMSSVFQKTKVTQRKIEINSLQIVAKRKIDFAVLLSDDESLSYHNFDELQYPRSVILLGILICRALDQRDGKGKSIDTQFWVQKTQMSVNKFQPTGSSSCP
jgi:hypothetical protein